MCLLVSYKFVWQVVYATLDTPIKHCSSELLYKLEGEMFPKEPFDDTTTDDIGSDEVIHDEGKRW